MRPALLAHDLGLLLVGLGVLGVVVGVCLPSVDVTVGGGVMLAVGASLYALSRALPPDERLSGREEFAARRRAERERLG